MNLIDQAIEFAAIAHRSQTRKGTDIPYITHPYAVGMILQQAKCKEEVIIAGILHDLLEDTNTKEEEICNRFGQHVLEIVIGCSEPNKELSWEERKRHSLEYLKHASLSIRQVACADKLHNLRSIKRDLYQMGDEVWKRFNRGRDSQKQYYTDIVESLGYSGRFPLLDLLQDVVEDVFGPSLEYENWEKLRRNKQFFDLAFEVAYGISTKSESWETKMNEIGGMKLIQQVHSLSYPIHPDFKEEFYHMGDYLQRRGIEFQDNSDGPIILVGFCTVLKKLLNLYPHEIYQHFKRNAKRGIL